MRTKRCLMALAPLIVLFCSSPVRDTVAEEPEDNRSIDALISIDSDCMSTAVTPASIKAQRGNWIRWGVTSECADEVDVSIAMKGADPLETCTRVTKKWYRQPAEAIRCKVKALAEDGHYEYSVSAGDKTLDPEIEIYP